MVILRAHQQEERNIDEAYSLLSLEVVAISRKESFPLNRPHLQPLVS